MSCHRHRPERGRQRRSARRRLLPDHGPIAPDDGPVLPACDLRLLLHRFLSGHNRLRADRRTGLPRLRCRPRWRFRCSLSCGARDTRRARRLRGQWPRHKHLWPGHRAGLDLLEYRRHRRRRAGARRLWRIGLPQGKLSGQRRQIVLSRHSLVPVPAGSRGFRTGNRLPEADGCVPEFRGRRTDSRLTFRKIQETALRLRAGGRVIHKRFNHLLVEEAVRRIPAIGGWCLIRVPGRLGRLWEGHRSIKPERSAGSRTGARERVQPVPPGHLQPGPLTTIPAPACGNHKR